MPEGHDNHKIDQVLRTMATASRSLRLYPAASPIPRQSVDAVVAALGGVFAEGYPSLTLAVAREGFESGGQPVAVGIPGGQELADEFRAHGVSAIAFGADASTDEVLTLLVALGRPADELRAEGGFARQLAAQGVVNVGVTEVILTVTDTRTPEGVIGDGTGHGTGFKADEAAQLAENPEQLGEWLRSASAGDRSDLESSLLSLVQAMGPDATRSLDASMATAFAEQSAETRDALLGLAMEPGPFRDLMGEMFRNQSTAQVAETILSGAYGRNMLSLSAALTSLPLGGIEGDVIARIHAMLPAAGHTDTEARFLDHMIEVRRLEQPEPSLAARDQTYLAVAQASAIGPEDLAIASRAVSAAGGAVDAAGVRTMLRLLDERSEPEEARESARSIVSMLARLLAEGQLRLADWLLGELEARAERVQCADLIRSAATPEALGGLVDALIADPGLEPEAAHILGTLGEGAAATLVAQAITHKAEGLRVAERLLGKRMMEPLNAAALQADSAELAPVITRLTVEGDSRCAATMEALIRRGDERSLKEIVSGLAAAGGPLAQRLLGDLVNSPSAEVATAAARALAKSGMPGSGAAIAARLSRLDLDNTDYDLGRELINALARTPDPIADQTLEKLGARRALIKRGRFADVQANVAAARAMRAREAIGR